MDNAVRDNSISRIEKIRPDVIPILLIAATASLLGIYAVYLNYIFYLNYGPFFDSMSYYNQMARFLGESSVHGINAGLNSALRSATSALAWMELYPFSGISQPSRYLAVWLQVPWVFILAVVGYLYFHHTMLYSRVLSLAFVFPLIFIHAIFYFNGGLADFRMDLLAYLTFGACCVAYLIARDTRSIILWSVWGAFLGAAVLARVPSVVYAVMVFGPLFLLDLVLRKGLVTHYVFGFGVAFLLSGWFIVLQYNYLYYYYVVWNADANAGLPISASRVHLKFLRDDIGQPILGFLCAVFLLRMFEYFPRQPNLAAFRKLAFDINWRPLWCAAVPVGYLVLSGKGPNPFVSMVSVSGLCIFLCAPIKLTEGPLRPWIAPVLLSISMIVCGYTALQGIRMHTDASMVSEWIPRREGLNKISELLEADLAKQVFSSPVRYEVTYVGSFTPATLENVLVFDAGWHSIHGMIEKGKWLLETHNSVGKFGDNKDAPALWKSIPGNSDDERLQYLAAALLRDVDYIFLPTDSSALPLHILINRYSRELAGILRKGRCVEVLGEDLKVSSAESVTILRNSRRGQGNSDCTPSP